MKLLQGLSALLLLVGWTAILIAGLLTWGHVVISATMSLGWFAGALLLIVSLGAFVYYENAVKAPFVFWLKTWRYADQIIRKGQET